MERLQIYETRTTDFQTQAETLRAKYVRFSFVRLLVFVVALAFIVFCFTQHIFIGVAAVVIFLLAFSKFVNWHQDIQRQQRHYKELSLLNQQEAAAQKMDYAAFDPGTTFHDPLHPNSIDMDLFGPWSFFQYACRASTAIGKERLAQMLSKPADKNTILERQAAVTDLKERLDWRQHFQAYGATASDALSHVDLLQQWLHDPTYVKNNKMLTAAIYLMPLWIATAILISVYYVHWLVGVLFLLLPGWILKSHLKRINETHSRTTHAEQLLSVYGQLIGHIEQEKFEAPLLQRLRKCFVTENDSASGAIGRLSYLIGQLNVRYNPFALILNLVLLWDLRYVRHLEIWKEKWRAQMPQWFEALREFEALSSLGTVWYNNPDWVLPQINDHSILLAEALGHPLIAKGKRVCNDFQSPVSGHIKLVTGSNMAGKSTFLRTVGLNIILAMSGAPVCARRMELPLLQLYSSMRTQDALHESTSSFYAELKRLKTIIEAVEAKDNIYFLMDEILKGTNSNDRHTGSKALIKQLIESGGGGIIATHDLELGLLEAQYGGAVENLCMEVEVHGDQLVFDYKIKKGLSQSFNATHLMRNMGIKIVE
jgi:MutS domain V